jgi:DNA polymerase elongation subunit (family B)
MTPKKHGLNPIYADTDGFYATYNGSLDDD